MPTVYFVEGEEKDQGKEDKKEATPEKKQDFLAKDVRQEVIIMSNIYFPSVTPYLLQNEELEDSKEDGKSMEDDSKVYKG